MIACTYERARGRHRYSLVDPCKSASKSVACNTCCFLKRVWLAEVGHRQLLFFGGSSFQADCFAASRSPIRTDPKELKKILLTLWDLLQRSLTSLKQSRDKTYLLLQQSEFSIEIHQLALETMFTELTNNTTHLRFSTGTLLT